MTSSWAGDLFNQLVQSKWGNYVNQFFQASSSSSFEDELKKANLERTEPLAQAPTPTKTNPMDNNRYNDLSTQISTQKPLPTPQPTINSQLSAPTLSHVTNAPTSPAKTMQLTEPFAYRYALPVHVIINQQQLAPPVSETKLLNPVILFAQIAPQVETIVHDIIRYMVTRKNGLYRIQFSMEPEDLGPIQLTLDMNDDTLTIEIYARSDVAQYLQTHKDVIKRLFTSFNNVEVKINHG